MKDHFEIAVTEALQHYVYCLVDPRTNKIFYIGKGQNNRVFDHANGSLNENHSSLKLNYIREIHNKGHKVLYYIIRHGLSEKEAKLVESVLIDLLTYEKFNTKLILTNIQAGYQQWDKGIKTTDEINLIYDCGEIVPNPDDHFVCININKTYKKKENTNIYEATRKYWRINGKRAKSAIYVLALYKGIVRAVFKPTRWYKSEEQEGRWEFDGIEVKDSPYLHKSVKNIITCGRNPISYYKM